MKLIFATNNQHKLNEVAAIIGNKFEPYPQEHQML